MTVRHPSRLTARVARPATVSLSQKSLTTWYAEWKAQKAAQAVTPTKPLPKPAT